MNQFKLKFHKLINWEYWPHQAIYFPLYPFWLYFSLRAKSFFFFNAANPSIKNGGMAMESKMEIYDLIPTQYIPKTILIKKGTEMERVFDALFHSNIEFPLIAKPDIGMKAFAVERIANNAELTAYSQKIPVDFLIQELIDYPKEAGIFYVRLPGENTGRITGIVSKEFLAVTGNGQDSIRELIHKIPRANLQMPDLARKYGDFLNSILREGDEFILVPFGSHTRGARFIDITDQSNQKLVDTINSICTQIPDFYFGRLDVRYATFEDLCVGKRFCIIEINGAGSEPTHIYDPKHSLLYAWKEIVKHWQLLYKISVNNRRNGCRYLSFSEGITMVNENKAIEAKLKLV